MLARALRLAPLAALVAAAAGCSSGPPPTPHNEGEGLPGERTSTTTEAISSDDAISRGMQWVTAKLLYCQSANGAPDYDTACSSTCTRQSNPQWDPYRSDCSGFVSWAWGLPSPGRVTSEFSPFNNDVTKTIQAIDLLPGDAVNRNSGGHMMLFEKWVTPGKSAIFMEEPGCSSSEPYAHEFTSDVTISGVDITIAYEGSTFTAIRFNQITESPAGDAGSGGSSGSSSGSSGGGSSGGGSGSSSGSSSGGSSGGAGSSSGGSSGSSGGSGSSGSSSGSTGGSSGSSSGGTASSGGSSGAGAAAHDAGAGNGAGSNGPVDWNSTNEHSGCSMAPGSARDGFGAGSLLALGLVIARRRTKRRA
jgi:hypothetical protein